MFNKLKEVSNALSAGKIVANPEAWKKGQVGIGHIVALLGSLVLFAKWFGYDIPLDEHTEEAMAVIILWLYSLFNHAATTVSTTKLDVLGRTKTSINNEGLPNVQSVDKSTDTGTSKRNDPSDSGRSSESLSQGSVSPGGFKEFPGAQDSFGA